MWSIGFIKMKNSINQIILNLGRVGYQNNERRVSMFKKLVVMLSVLLFGVSIVSAQMITFNHLDPVKEKRWMRSVATIKATKEKIAYISVTGKNDNAEFYVDYKGIATIRLPYHSFISSNQITVKIGKIVPVSMEVNAQPDQFTFNIKPGLVSQMKKGKRIAFGYNDFGKIKVISFTLTNFSRSYRWLIKQKNINK